MLVPQKAKFSGLDMIARSFLSYVIGASALIWGTQHARAVTDLDTYYSEAVATGPFNSVSVGPRAASISQATSPDTVIYYDPTISGYDGLGGIPTQFGGASALANVTTHELHAGAGTTTNVNGYALFGWSASAQWGDTFLFTHTGASASQITTINFTVQITGTIGDLPNYGNNASVSYNIDVGGGAAFGGIPGNFNQSGVNLVNPVGIIWQYSTPGYVDQTITGSLEFTGNAAIIPIAQDLYVSGAAGYADILDTATFSFGTLPLGVSYTATSAVPEPATWAMIIFGFAGIGFMAYRRKSSPALMAA